MAPQGVIEFTKAAAEEWSTQLKRLLEEKHLYQSVEAAIPALRARIQASVHPGQVQQFELAIGPWGDRRLVAVMKPTYENTNIGGGMVQVTSSVLLATNMKLFCIPCGAPEVFSPLWAKDISSDCIDHRGSAMPRKNNSQLFVLAFQCQRCSSDPEGFIVRRRNYKLYLEGRSPMEQVQVPKEIPKTEAGYFRDGIIANQSGKPLAGVLYLRVFLEAFARRQTGHSTRASGDVLMDEYAKLIPAEQRALMPSLKDWYGKLSEVIHAGREDADLFEEASRTIHRHFEFRRLFQIPDVTANLVIEENSTTGEDPVTVPESSSN